VQEESKMNVKSENRTTMERDMWNQWDILCLKQALMETGLETTDIEEISKGIIPLLGCILALIYSSSNIFSSLRER